MTKHRVRTCKTCGKRLGGTVVNCYECGGEKPSRDDSEKMIDAAKWKLALGVDPELIEDAHGMDIDYAKI